MSRSTWLWLAGWLARFIVATVLVAASVPKVLDAPAFAQSIANYRLVPDAWASVLAVVVPVLELVVAASLFVPSHARGAAAVAAAMLTVFALAIAQALLREIDLSCGCFGGAGATPTTWWSVVRNAGLVALAGLAFVAPCGRTSASPDAAAATSR